AIATKADAIWGHLNKTQRLITRRVLLRLVQFGEGRADTRRQQSIGALSVIGDDSIQLETTLRILIESRLLTVSGDEANGERRIDIAHEVLISGWPMLKSWLYERREAEQSRQRLEAKAEEWVRLGQSSGGLLD